MNRLTQATLAVGVCLSGIGCDALAPYVRNDTPYAYQRQQIERYDPYPYNDVAPAMVGVRPPDFDEPVSEAVRARWSTKPPPWVSPPLPPPPPQQPLPQQPLPPAPY